MVSGRNKKRPASRTRGRRPRAQRWLFRYGWLLPVGAVFIGGSILLLTYAFASIPLPQDIRPAASAQVFDRNGRLIGSFSGEQRRFLLTPDELDGLPDYVGEAIVAAEDRDFYKHNGVSLRGIMRAAWANVTGGEIQQGGSTITQQYVKNAVLQDSARTVTRKLKEAILAIKLERRYSKEEILGFYLNTIYFGRGAYGIEAAARTYFGHKDPYGPATAASQLKLDEAAYLAGIVPAPESYQPDRNQRGARARRDRTLDLMVRQGYISGRQADRASRGKVKLADGTSHLIKRQRAAYFMEWLRRDILEPEFGGELYTRGIKIYTTLDMDMQNQAEQAISEVLTLPEDPQAALVSMTPRGEVRAFVGGRQFTNVKRARGFNFASDNRRQPGSSFKPFTLLAAIEDDISPSSRFSGRSPVTIPDEECYTDGQPWQPDNYANSQYGTVTLDQATTNSINTVYAQLIAEIGAGKVAELAEDFGFPDVPAHCSIALGSHEVTPVEMARAYAGFSAHGLLPQVTPIRYVLDSAGNCIVSYVPRKNDCEDEEEKDPRRVVEANSADVLSQTLTHVVEAGTAVNAALPDREVAGKTGTSQINKDAWFAGYIPQLTTVVWMGYPCQKGCGDGIEGNELVPLMRYCSDPELCRPVHGVEVTGGSSVGPAVIWGKFMTLATAGMEVVSFPAPEDTPDEIINSPAPAPSPTKSPKPKESPSQSPIPSPAESPTIFPSPSESPSESPGILPTPSAGPDQEESSCRVCSERRIAVVTAHSVAGMSYAV